MESGEDIEIQNLLAGILANYGYDFRGYSRASLKRRLLYAQHRSRSESISEMHARILADPGFFREFLSDITVNVTEMFRDPMVYLAIRKHVIPILRTYPSVRIWHAGCASGEEAYSMAILLEEEGLYDKTLLYSTDISPRAIDRAKEGIYPASLIRAYTANYQKAGGVESFSNYYTAKYESVKLASSLRRNIVFTLHNLATDDIFSEVQMVLCRNVLIYFDRDLQKRVLDLFRRSLVRRGYLCLGSKESVEFSGMQWSFDTEMKHEKIYRKI